MNILVVKPRVETAVSYYRGTTPIAHLCRVKGWQMQVVAPKDITPDTIAGFNILFDIRPTSEESIHTIFMAKRAGLKVWIDIDDLLWRIPAANIASRTWGQTAYDNLLRAVLNTDIVTVSTDYLAQELSKEFGKPCAVIPNAWNDYAGELPERWNAPEDGQPFQILYRGSNTHAGDLFAHRDAFRDVEGIEYRFMGEFPWYMFRHYGGHLDTIIHEKWQNNILGYFARLDAIRPQAFVFPLEDNPFNRAKSNIAWIEATMCGAVCIASQLPEFAKIASFAMHGAIDFNDIADDHEAIEDVYQESRQYIEGCLRLSEINEQRAAVVDLITGNSVDL